MSDKTRGEKGWKWMWCGGIRTPSTAGSSWTLLKVVGSSTDRSLTSEARKMMYWYGSCTGGMNSDGGLQCAKNGRQVSSTYAISEDNRKRKRAAHGTYVQPRAPLIQKKLVNNMQTHGVSIRFKINAISTLHKPRKEIKNYSTHPMLTVIMGTTIGHNDWLLAAIPNTLHVKVLCNTDFWAQLDLIPIEIFDRNIEHITTIKYMKTKWQSIVLWY